jgi:hypothetical protein
MSFPLFQEMMACTIQSTVLEKTQPLQGQGLAWC